jgi:hypothetical protein
MDAHHAHRGHNQQETGEGNHQFGPDTHKRSSSKGDNAIAMPVAGNL